MKRAVIFDLDGTLLNTVESMAVAGNRMLRDLGLRPQPVDRYRYYAGDGADMLIHNCVPPLFFYAADHSNCFYDITGKGSCQLFN